MTIRRKVLISEFYVQCERNTWRKRSGVPAQSNLKKIRKWGRVARRAENRYTVKLIEEWT